MSNKGARGELAAARFELPPHSGARATGPKGRFTPRRMDAVVTKDGDGVLLITLRQLPRPAAVASGAAASEWTMPLLMYLQFAGRVESAIADALTNGP